MAAGGKRRRTAKVQRLRIGSRRVHSGRGWQGKRPGGNSGSTDLFPTGHPGERNSETSRAGPWRWRLYVQHAVSFSTQAPERPTQVVCQAGAAYYIP